MLYKKDSLAKVVNTIVHLFDDIKAKVKNVVYWNITNHLFI